MGFACHKRRPGTNFAYLLARNIFGPCPLGCVSWTGFGDQLPKLPLRRVNCTHDMLGTSALQMNGHTSRQTASGDYWKGASPLPKVWMDLNPQGQREDSLREYRHTAFPGAIAQGHGMGNQWIFGHFDGLIVDQTMPCAHGTRLPGPRKTRNNRRAEAGSLLSDAASVFGASVIKPLVQGTRAGLGFCPTRSLLFSVPFQIRPAPTHTNIEHSISCATSRATGRCQRKTCHKHARPSLDEVGFRGGAITPFSLEENKKIEKLGLFSRRSIIISNVPLR